MHFLILSQLLVLLWLLYLRATRMRKLCSLLHLRSPLMVETSKDTTTMLALKSHQHLQLRLCSSSHRCGSYSTTTPPAPASTSIDTGAAPPPPSAPTDTGAAVPPPAPVPASGEMSMGNGGGYRRRLARVHRLH
ncbi:hypothetical protein OSTOST_14989 [Ostertagia ostertagi]